MGIDDWGSFFAGVAATCVAALLVLMLFLWESVRSARRDRDRMNEDARKAFHMVFGKESDEVYPMAPWKRYGLPHPISNEEWPEDMPLPTLDDAL